MRLSGANRTIKLSIIWVIEESALIRFGEDLREAIGTVAIKANDITVKDTSIYFFMGWYLTQGCQREQLKKYVNWNWTFKIWIKLFILGKLITKKLNIV